MNSCHAESWEERSPLGAESALHVGQEALHWGQRWKNFSKREKQTNKKIKTAKQKGTYRNSQHTSIDPAKPHVQHHSLSRCHPHPWVNDTRFGTASPVSPVCSVLTHLANLLQGFHHLPAIRPLGWQRRAEQTAGDILLLLPRLDAGHKGLATDPQLTQHLHLAATPGKLKHPAELQVLSRTAGREVLPKRVYFKAVQIICLDSKVELTGNILFWNASHQKKKHKFQYPPRNFYRENTFQTKRISSTEGRYLKIWFTNCCCKENQTKTKQTNKKEINN